MKTVGIILVCLLLLTPSILLSSAQTSLSLEWQRNSGFDMHTGINGQYTLIAHPEGNTTTRVEFYLDDKLELSDTKAPYSWTFNTDSNPEGQHTIRVEAYTSTGETATLTDIRSFSGFPYMFIVGVLLFASIVFAFALLLTWHVIKQKAKARRIAGKTGSASMDSSKR
jgi:hypothetical protein